MKRHRWQTYTGKGRAVPKRISDSIEAYLWASDFRKSNIDPFSGVGVESDPHNGPRCIDCGRAECWHCHGELLLEECPARLKGERGAE